MSSSTTGQRYGVAKLDDVVKLSPYVTRILGQNPSMMTLQGTNSYLLQTPSSPSSPIILIDTSSPHTAQPYVDILITHLKSLSKEHAQDISSSTSKIPQIEHIILTHRHLDHVGAVPTLLRELSKSNLPPPRIHKMPSADEEQLRSSEKDEPTSDAILISSLPEGLFTPFHPNQPLHPISTDTVVKIIGLDPRTRSTTGADIVKEKEQSSAEPGISLRCIATPGHTQDSISILMEQGNERCLFTGDTVLGEGTTVFTDLGAYLNSLRTLLDLGADVLYPAHGPAILGKDEVSKHIQTYITHRQDREDQIISILQDNSRSTPITIEEVVHGIYKSVDEKLLAAASKPVLAHLAKLEKEGRVNRIGVSSDGTEFWQMTRDEGTS